ncbi:MAG: tol-pal system protein YbgF [Filomicrobium sp.]
MASLVRKVVCGLVFVGLSVVFVAGVSQAPRADETAALKQRVQQLEQQLVDMQVAVGTLQSMGGAGPQATAGYGPQGSAGSFSAGGAGSNARLDGIETQIQALTLQMEQLARDVRALSGGQRGSLPTQGRNNYAAGPQTAPQIGVQRQSLNDSVDFGGFGSTTVSRNDDGIGGLLSNGAVDFSGNGGGASAKQVYETAYGYLLQQDYGAAESAFRDFLQRYPSDGLAGNAQYWLGESLYLRGQYKSAATAFLEGYEKHRQNGKAPDSLLKLAMSLNKLGKRDAACSSFTELSVQFPNAPQHVRQRAASERRRAGC